MASVFDEQKSTNGRVPILGGRYNGSYRMNRPIWRDDVQCDVVSLSYDFSARKGVLHLDEGNCTDMSGCIGIFVAIDPDVRRIDTIAGKITDTVYVRRGDRWFASERWPEEVTC